MSTTTTSIRRTEHPTSTTSRRESAVTSSTATSTTSEETPESTTLSQHISSIQLDTSIPTPSTTSQDSPDDTAIATTSSIISNATCTSNSDCTSDKICSNGACAQVLDAAPFGPAEGSNLQPMTHMNTASAIGIGLGVVSLFVMILILFIWFWKRRGGKLRDESIEAPPFNPTRSTNRTRSASSATDQKTLVASLPNSPQQGNFREQQEQMLTASFAQLVTSNKITDHSCPEKEKFAHEERKSTDEKSLPLPPNDMPLPPPPTQDVRYAINVNINKSMIFDDVMFNMASRDGGTPRDSGTSRDRMPKYRFEEYLPPVAKTPTISIRQQPNKPTSEIEMKPYPRKDSSSPIESESDDEEDSETRSRRNNIHKKLESKPPQLPLPDLLPPPSPSFSFRSYDWYQDIIGTEQTNAEDTMLGAPTPSIPDRNPARTPTKTTFGAVLTSNRPSSLLPAPLSPSAPRSSVGATHLHPSTAALVSPTSTTFRLSPTVYTMPSRPPKAQPMRASLRSTMTQQTHMSQSWLPEDGLYLPEEGTHDSFTVFKRQLSDASRPTSYSPLQ